MCSFIYVQALSADADDEATYKLSGKDIAGQQVSGILSNIGKADVKHVQIMGKRIQRYADAEGCGHRRCFLRYTHPQDI